MEYCKRLSFNLFILSFLFSCNENERKSKVIQSSEIKFSKLKNQYRFSDTLKFTFVNNSVKKYYYLTVEKFNNNNWEEGMYCFEKPMIMKAQSLSILESKQVINKNICFKESTCFSKRGKYRLKIVYDKRIKGILEKEYVYSNPFQVVN